jgi:uncharacterized protein YndB with AHSA1/START domain
MSIAPIVRSVEVAVPPARAFELFTRSIGQWWGRGRTPAKNPHADIVIEPKAGGRWYEIDDEGTINPWGHVIAYEPPARLVLGWQLGKDFTLDPNLVTEVEVTFEPAGKGTKVTLEHRDLERFGADADEMRGKLDSGWPGVLGRFTAFVADPSA